MVAGEHQLFDLRLDVGVFVAHKCADGSAHHNTDGSAHHNTDGRPHPLTDLVAYGDPYPLADHNTDGRPHPLADLNPLGCSDPIPQYPPSIEYSNLPTDQCSEQFSHSVTNHYRGIVGRARGGGDEVVVVLAADFCGSCDVFVVDWMCDCGVLWRW